MDDLFSLDELAEPILDVIGALVVILDKSGRIVHFNRACQETTGYDFSEVNGIFVWDILLKSDEIQTVQSVFSTLSAGSFPNQFTNYWVTKAGKHRLISWSNTASLSHEGDVRYVIATGIDITAQKEAEDALREREAKLRAILDTAVDAIITISEEGLVEDLNPAAERMFEYAASELVGQNVKILMPPPYRDKHDEYIRRYRETGEKRIIGIDREGAGRRKDGTDFPVELSISEITEADRRYFVGVIRDITARKEADEALRHAQKMEAIGQLSGGIAHDFNNLLTVVLGSLEMLEARVGRGRDLRILQLAREAAELGSKLTNRLLAFGRRQPLEPRVLDVNDLVLGMSDMMRRALGETIRVSVVLANDLWHTRVDPGQVENALLNLAINARDAMPDGGVVTIETRNVELDEDCVASQVDVAPGPYVQLSVTDTGAGMPPEIRDRAFEPFFTTKRDAGGTGLGLSMVYGFAKQSGGHVSITSEVGQGASVSLYLPCITELEEGAEDREARESLPPAAGERILVVEDDPRVRLITVSRLKEIGYAVLEAENGSAALELLEQTPSIDLLFTDLVMGGGISGQDLAQRACRLRPGIKVLLTTGYAGGAATEGGMMAHGQSLLRKPYTSAELAHKIEIVLHA